MSEVRITDIPIDVLLRIFHLLHPRLLSLDTRTLREGADLFSFAATCKYIYSVFSCEYKLRLKSIDLLYPFSQRDSRFHVYDHKIYSPTLKVLPILCNVHLQSLHLNPKVQCKVLRHVLLRTATHCSNLKQLSFYDGGQLNDDIVDNICSKLRSLEYIDVSNISERVALSFQSSYPNLKTLKLLVSDTSVLKTLSKSLLQRDVNYVKKCHLVNFNLHIRPLPNENEYELWKAMTGFIMSIFTCSPLISNLSVFSIEGSNKIVSTMELVRYFMESRFKQGKLFRKPLSRLTILLDCPYMESRPFTLTSSDIENSSMYSAPVVGQSVIPKTICAIKLAYYVSENQGEEFLKDEVERLNGKPDTLILDLQVLETSSLNDFNFLEDGDDKQIYKQLLSCKSNYSLACITTGKFYDSSSIFSVNFIPQFLPFVTETICSLPNLHRVHILYNSIYEEVCDDLMLSSFLSACCKVDVKELVILTTFDETQLHYEGQTKQWMWDMEKLLQFLRFVPRFLHFVQLYAPSLNTVAVEKIPVSTSILSSPLLSDASALAKKTLQTVSDLEAALTHLNLESLRRQIQRWIRIR